MFFPFHDFHCSIHVNFVWCRFCGRNCDCQLRVSTNHVNCLQELDFYICFSRSVGVVIWEIPPPPSMDVGPLVVNFHVAGGGERWGKCAKNQGGGGASTGGCRGAGAGGGLLQFICRSEYFSLNMQPTWKTS